ncbi:hypothetical protein [Aliikangiella maris]|uniref:Uncharacterized protein n=2 Tax=Aliikangiella maris TaxID=3162458 RepID=A0ABV3MI89_9GAMM
MHNNIGGVYQLNTQEKQFITEKTVGPTRFETIQLETDVTNENDGLEIDRAFEMLEQEAQKYGAIGLTNITELIN